MASDAQPQAHAHNGVIELTGSFAPLFGGSTLGDCLSVDDPTCITGSAATAVAFARHLASNGVNLMIPFLDKQSQFVQSHPLGWNVNRLILNRYFGYKFYTTPASILVQDQRDFEVSQRDLRGLQSQDFPLLLTNAAAPPSVSWFPFVKRVYYDEASTLAIMNIMGLQDPLTVDDPIAALKAGLDEIALENEHTGCRVSTSAYDEYLVTHNLQPERSTEVIDLLWENGNGTTATMEEGSSTTTTEDSTTTRPLCWKPAIYFSDTDPEMFAQTVEALRQHRNPPAFIFDGGDNGDYYEPTALETTPKAKYAPNMWVHTMPYTWNGYYQTTINLTPDHTWIDSISWQVLDMTEDMTEEVLNDPQYREDFDYIRGLVREAEQHDPATGYSTAMPATRSGDYRRCKGGECELGNLFADALRWKAGADVAFITSGGLRGTGWDAGPVTVSQIWASLPFPNTICEGVMTGVNLFKIVEYSMGAATFQSTETTDGGRLIQVSGMRIVYNTELDDDHRVISIDVWDSTSSSYQPIERVKLYKFATDSFLCGAYVPFPFLLGKNGLKLDGEVPGKIGDEIHQNIVGDYLGSLATTEPYNATIEGRLVNDTSAIVPLNLIQTEEGCPPHTYWVESKASCLNCPNSSHVSFSDEKLEFTAVSGVDTLHSGRIVLVNREMEPFYVVPKSMPDWFQFSNMTSTSSTNIDQILAETLLNPGDSLALDFLVSAEQLETGTATGTVSFGVLDGSGLLGCVDNNDATFDVILRVVPRIELNQLGNMMFFGWVLMTITILAALGFAVWTYLNRKVRIVKTMQPLFLQMICAGILVMSFALGSLSLDDGVVSQEWCNFACMSLPWFVSMGWTITFAAIHAKLWRINKLFSNPHFRRVVVSEKDALVAFSLLFGINFVLLLLWSLVDPLEWTRQSVPGEMWNTYGVCGSGPVGDALMGVVVTVNVCTLCLATYQAYKARNISGEFSESRKLGLAVYTWLQVIAVGLPVLFLIDREDVIARYFLVGCLIFFLCITMVCNIFLPIIIQKTKLDKARENGEAKPTNVHISGLTPNGLPKTTTTKFHDSNLSRPSNGSSGLPSLNNSMASNSGVSFQARRTDEADVIEGMISEASLEDLDGTSKTIP